MRHSRYLLTAPLLGSFLTLAVPGLDAPAARAAHSSAWQTVATDNVPSIDQPALHRYHHTLVLAWVQQEPTGGQVLMTRRYDARNGGAQGGAHKVMPAWAAINTQPQLTFVNDQRALVFAGIHNPSTPTDPYNDGTVFYLTSGDAKVWTLQPGALSHTNGVAAAYGLAAINDAGAPVVAFALSPNGWITFHQGVSTTIPASTSDGTTSHDSKCCVYDPGLGRDEASGRVWTAWYSNSPSKGWNGVSAQAIPSGKRYHAPASSMRYNGAWSSVSSSQTVQLASRPHGNHGGVYTAYPIGYPSPTTIGVWKVGTAKTAFRINTGDLVSTVGVTPATGGRLWVYWSDRSTGKVEAALTNASATKITSTHTLAPPNKASYQAQNLVGDGSKGRLNLVAVMGGTKEGIFYTQVKP